MLTTLLFSINEDQIVRDLYGTLNENEILSTALKALVIYLFATVLVRAGKSRLLGRATVFDIIMAYILGSMLSRAINGNAEPLPTAVAAVVLVLLHWLFGLTAFHSHRIGNIIKGRADVVVRDGKVDEQRLHDHHISQHDLEEAMRKAGIDKVEHVKLATFERDGKLSIVPEFRVIEVDVKQDVQRVRIEV